MLESYILMSTLPSKTDPCDSITTFPDKLFVSHKYEAEILSRYDLNLNPNIVLRQPRLPIF